MNNPIPRTQVTFKTLRAMDASTLSSKPLEINLKPEAVHFQNANGGLRLIEPEEVRGLANQSASRLMSAGLGVE